MRVLGTTDDLAHLLRDNKPDEVLIAIPSAPGRVRQKIVETCRAEDVPVKTLPGLHELIAGDLNLAGQIRPVQVEDVLGRQQVEVDLGLVAAYVKDKTVLVTGAGGSIGSELCRQLARLGAARLVLVDKGESALFEIERELVDERDFPAAIPVLADCGDRAKMRQVFERYRPQVSSTPPRTSTSACSRRTRCRRSRTTCSRRARSPRWPSSSASSGSCSSRPTRPRTRRT